MALRNRTRLHSIFRKIGETRDEELARAFWQGLIQAAAKIMLAILIWFGLSSCNPADNTERGPPAVEASQPFRPMMV